MTAFELLSAFGGADDEQLRSAGALLGYEEDIMHLSNKKTKRVFRAVLLIAAVLAALGVTAYAAGLFSQHLKQPAEGETVKLKWSIMEPDGSVYEGGDIEVRNVGLVISYDGTAGSEVEFRPGWLPEGPKAVTRGGSGEGYCDFLDSYTDDPADLIPYQVSAYYACPGFKIIVQGKVEIVKEETWDKLEVTEFVQTVEYGDGQKLVTNFVLLFHPDEGWMISVGGAESFDTLEHIARELDVRSTGAAPTWPDLTLNDFTALGVARG